MRGIFNASRAIVLLGLFVTACAAQSQTPVWPTRPFPYGRSNVGEATAFYRDHRAEHRDPDGNGPVRFGEHGQWVPIGAAGPVLRQSPGAETDLDARDRGVFGLRSLIGGLALAAIGGIVAGVGAATDNPTVTDVGWTGLSVGGAATVLGALLLQNNPRDNERAAVVDFNDWLWQRMNLPTTEPPPLTPEAPGPVAR